jgi:integrase
MLPGLHRVKKRKAEHVTEYWYAWRGGPQILKVKARGDQELARLVARAAPAAVEAYKANAAPQADNVTLYGLVTRYLVALEAMPGAVRTKGDRRKYLDVVRTDLGELEIRALESKRARQVLITWRDRYKATPKTADERLGALSKVIDWAVDRGDISTNPIKDVAGLYTAPDRSEIIWEPHHLELLLAHATPAFGDLVQLAVHTGIRLGDIRKLTWSAVGDDAIVFQTGKSNRKRTVVIPITDPLRDILTALPRGDSVTVLNSSRQRPWSEAGAESAIQTAKRKALEKTQEQHGPAAKTGIEHLRIHDMRGTAATNFMVHGGLEDEDIAVILGWKRETVGEIRRRYISGQAIGLAIVRRMRENKQKLLIAAQRSGQ